MNTTSLDQIKDRYYGETGIPERDQLNRVLESHCMGYMLHVKSKQWLNSNPAERGKSRISNPQIRNYST